MTDEAPPIKLTPCGDCGEDYNTVVMCQHGKGAKQRWVCAYCQTKADDAKKAARLARREEAAVRQAALKEARRIDVKAKRTWQVEKRKLRKERVVQQARKERQAQKAIAAHLSESNSLERELAARVMARQNLLAFTVRHNPKYLPGWVHKDVARRLKKFSDDVIAGLSPRLMLQMPPRHGKSELASINLPAWHLGRAPDHEIIEASYAASLALKFSRKVRSILREDRFAVEFPNCHLDNDNQNAEGWMTTKGGGLVPAGVGGPITGKGAHMLIIDDPVKNAEEAESENTREAIWDWYTSTAYTRLAPGGGVLIIMTRWHDDDLCGRLEAKMALDEGDSWEVVRYPAEAEEDEVYRKKGEALHPERYPIEALTQIKRAVGPRVWSALYQQQPTADDGHYFTRSMIVPYTSSPPENLVYYTAWDLAIGKNDRNDWTVGVTVGVDEDDNMWVVDMRRGRWDTFEIVEEVLSVHRLYRAHATGLEKGQIQMAIGPYLDKRIQEERLYDLIVEELPPGRRDKESRARPIQGRMRQGKVFFPKSGGWVDILTNELLRFPNGTHDDCVDALAWVGMMLNDMDRARPPHVARSKKRSWRETLGLLVTGRRSPMAA